jgi:glycosyltransferase involved in cell wall biosynthesis
MQRYDVVIASDLRFPGGSSASTLEEIALQARAGLRTGVYHLPASTLRRRRGFHPGILRAILDGQCDLLNPEIALAPEPVAADLLVVRHPSVIDHQGGPLPELEAGRAVLVVNHPPINAQGRIDYLLPYALRRLREAYAAPVEAAPIGPLVRAAIDQYYDDRSLLSDEDWHNVFDLERFRPRAARPPHDPIRIGRHSRPNREKWPSRAQDILAAYPDDAAVDVRILGGSEIPERILGYRPANWTVEEFGARAVESFLEDLDVFVYYHHPNWVEAFGRVTAEAMATGLPAILPPHFRELFGDAALYGPPAEVPGLLDRLRDPDTHAAMSQRAAGFIHAHFGGGVHLERLARRGVRLPAADRSAAE